MQLKIGLATLTSAIVIAALPAAASADASDPPSCFGEFVSMSAQNGIVGPFVSGTATSGPGVAANFVRTSKAGC